MLDRDQPCRPIEAPTHCRREQDHHGEATTGEANLFRRTHLRFRGNPPGRPALALETADPERRRTQQPLA